MSRGEREAELLDTLESVIDEGLPYVLVGGWAITAFKPRFTVDVDAVAPSESLDQYTALLGACDYDQVADVETTPLYGGRTVRFKRDIGNPVTFDLMLDALGCRQTDAEWSYRYLLQHSREASLGATRTLTARIPEPELLFALKLHSGRIADARDLVALAAEADFDRVENHLYRGTPEKLQQQIEAVLTRITDETFADGFKGVFEQGTVPEADIKRTAEFLRDQRR
jgi:hypothetical protein